MRLFTKDSDGKFDTPLSVWIGLAFIGIALFFEANKIGPGGLSLSWDLGVNAFFLITGLIVLIPGVLLTMLGQPDQ